VPGFDGVWAIGDAAAVPDPAAKRQRATPPTAQHALRQGRLVGANVAAALGHGHLRKFTYKTLGVFVDMGRHQAVAEMVGIRIRGFPAWFAARTYHLALMPGGGRRLRLVVDWTVGLFFKRSSPELGQLGHPPALTAEATEGELPGSG
jgi:NADH dehydrogenase